MGCLRHRPSRDRARDAASLADAPMATASRP